MKLLKIISASFLMSAIFFCISCTAESDENVFATSKAMKVPRQELIVYSSPQKYSYENLLHDIKIIEDAFPSQVKVMKLCDTPDGRGVYDIVLGDIDGDNQILIFGAMHAREYITTQIVMRQLCESIDALNGYGGTYRGISDAELLQGVTIHFVPNSNPDGVAIS